MGGLVVLGAGPGIGLSVARRFGREGLPVVLVGRSGERLARLAEQLRGHGVAEVSSVVADCGEEESLRGALERTGVPDVLVYNAAQVRADAVGELTLAEHQAVWAVNVGGAVVAAASVLPRMAGRGHGSFIVTGGMPVAKPEYVSLSLGKAGVRALVELLDARYRAAGVHVATVTVDGPVAPGTAFDPEDIAEHYWRLHTQERAEWVAEIVHSGR